MKKIIATISLLLLSACSTPQQSNPHTTVVSSAGVSASTLTKARISQARNAVKLRLKDPNSARFGDIVGAVLTYADGSTRLAACGLVNAKNSYGGYAGDDMYLVMFDKTVGAVAIMDAELICQKYRIV